MPRIFKVSFISEGQFLKAGSPVPDELIRPYMLKYSLKSAPVPDEEVRYQITDTSIPLARHVRRTAQREMAEMAAAVHHQEQLDEELDAERKRDDERLKPSIEDAQERHQAETERRKKELEINAQRGDEILDDIIREKEERLREEGFYSTDDAASENSDSEPEPEGRDSKSETGAGLSASKPKPKSSKLFVKRDDAFVPSSSVDLIKGETLFRHRKRAFGKPERFIAHKQV